MIEIDRATLRMAAFDADLDFESQFVFGYSGRFMYGSTTFGLTGSVSDLAKFMAALGGIDRDEDSEGGLGFDLNEFADRISTDSYGRSDTIFYWPGVEVVD